MTAFILVPCIEENFVSPFKIPIAEQSTLYEVGILCDFDLIIVVDKNFSLI